MTRLRRLLVGCVIAGGTLAITAGAASAATFYVDQRGSTKTCLGRGTLACPTIKEAITAAEATKGPNTIEVESNEGEEGKFQESIELLSSKDAGLTIDGEEPGVVIEGKGTLPALAAHLAGAVTVSNLSIEAGPGSLLPTAVTVHGANVTLDNVAVENQQSGGINGIESREGGSVTMNGGSVSMENGTTGDAVYGFEGALALNGVKILDGSESEANAGGVYSERSSLAVTNSKIYVESGGGGTTFGIAAGKDTSVALENVAVRQNTNALGVVLENAPATVKGLRVEMQDASSKLAALLAESEPGSSSTFSHLEIGGTWIGSGALAFGGNASFSDSRVAQSSFSPFPALEFVGNGPGTGLLVQRSVLQAAPGAKPGALDAVGANATTDSSEILGGTSGVYFENTTASTQTLTLSASTIDAGAPGIAADAAGVDGVEAVSKTVPGSVVNVSIQGSIVLEKQSASAAAGDQASVACSYSATSNQSQAAGGGSGAISCASGSGGNTEVNPLSALFAEPLAEYHLNPSSSAVDSVPPAALALPFGFTPSATDLAGNARTVDGNGDCVAVQDKGALELQGHSAACPVALAKGAPATFKGLAGVISGLSVSPGAFSAAPAGATISANHKRKKKYGATISYRDSQAATTTFTVLRQGSGRRQGKSCHKPSRSNRHARRCTILTAVGSFAHLDAAGAEKLHFSGRLKARKLAPGTYQLQAIAHDAAGDGAPAKTGFAIR